MGFLDKLKFNRLKEGLAKTRDSVMAKVARVIKAKRKIDDELLDEIEEILILGDVGVATTARIIDRLRERVKRERYEDASELGRLLREEVSALFERHNVSTDGTSIELPAGITPYVIMVVGVNGVGKTTTIGKLAYNYRSSGKRVIIGAADTFPRGGKRAARSVGAAGRRGDHPAASRFGSRGRGLRHVAVRPRAARRMW
jgi:fused signal recognition particle receptor